MSSDKFQVNSVECRVIAKFVLKPESFLHEKYDFSKYQRIAKKLKIQNFDDILLFYYEKSYPSKPLLFSGFSPKHGHRRNATPNLNDSGIEFLRDKSQKSIIVKTSKRCIIL